MATDNPGLSGGKQMSMIRSTHFRIFFACLIFTQCSCFVSALVTMALHPANKRFWLRCGGTRTIHKSALANLWLWI